MKNGYFDRSAREFVITDMAPRRPLINYIWNEEFLMGIDHTGQGKSFAKVGYNTRRMVIDPAEGSRLIYVKDRATGAYFCANKPFFAAPHDAYETRVGVGKQAIVGEKLGVRVTLTLTAPTSGFAELWRIDVENRTEQPRDLSLYLHAMLAENVTDHYSYNRCDWSDPVGGLLFEHAAYLPPHDYPIVYLCADRPVNSYTTSQTTFKGHYRTYAEPIGVEADQLDNAGGSYDDWPSAAMELRLAPAAGETLTTYVVCGTARTAAEAADDARKFLQNGFFERVLEERLAKSKADEGVFTLSSGNAYLDEMVNVWLKNQIDLGKTWARVYGKGFRDVMQDVAAFASFDPATAKEKFCCASPTNTPTAIPSVCLSRFTVIPTATVLRGFPKRFRST
ncbi:MAG: hypothetical protein IJC17_06440 [Clostridia bacterium]|nr:hypothetical protein [Clostridia bacterium]